MDELVGAGRLCPAGRSRGHIAGEEDVDTLSEVLWATLHGLTMLGRSDRLRSGYSQDRIDLLVARFRALPLRP